MRYSRVAALRIQRFSILTVLAAIIGAVMLIDAGAAAQPRPQQPEPKPTVVLVHGAWADGAGWNGVIEYLHDAGYPVVAPANPLRGLASDAAYIKSVLDSISGPLVVVGHSYGGAVITNAAAGNPNVKALVYIAAYIPDVGETLLGLTSQFPGSRLDPNNSLIVRDYPAADGSVGHDAYIKPELFHELFAADLTANTAALMAATQRPAEATILGMPSAAAAWQEIPAFCLVAGADNVIGTANVRFMAERACDTPVEIDASHAVLVSQPGAVATLILTAAGQ